MKIDIISIFPEYLDALNFSLIGKARQKRLLSLAVHDLRSYTDDKHRTVDDTPYGGGAGMVMKVEPWIRALENIDVKSGERAVLIIPSPSGDLFSQRVARELALQEHIIFACGRYEGIDQRVEELAGELFDVRSLSLGDYVLNGGESAALVMVEAIARLVPGVIGNERSLEEESHGDNGLLEYPVYTKPAVWRGAAVPEVLLSGNHQEIFLWRFRQRLSRTRQRRPELFANLDPESFTPQQRAVYERIKKGRPEKK